MFPLGAEVDVSVLSNATSSWEPGYAAVRGLVGFLSPEVYISLLGILSASPPLVKTFAMVVAVRREFKALFLLRDGSGESAQGSPLCKTSDSG